MPCGRATPEAALRLFLWLFHPQGRWPAGVLYPLGYPTAYGPGGDEALVLRLVSSLFSSSSKFAFQFTIESVEDEQIGLFGPVFNFITKDLLILMTLEHRIDRKTIQIFIVTE
jgi:hypothetical protein